MFFYQFQDSGEIWYDVLLKQLWLKPEFEGTKLKTLRLFLGGVHMDRISNEQMNLNRVNGLMWTGHQLYLFYIHQLRVMGQAEQLHFRPLGGITWLLKKKEFLEKIYLCVFLQFLQEY